MHCQSSEADHIDAKNQYMAIPLDMAVVILDRRGVRFNKSCWKCRLKSFPLM